MAATNPSRGAKRKRDDGHDDHSHLVLSISRTPSKPLPERICLTQGVGVPIVVGRESPADVILTSKDFPLVMSKKHATLTKEMMDGLPHWRLIDTKSTNGVFVNDVKIDSALLRDGDVIVFSGTGAPGKLGSKKSAPPDWEFVFRFEEEDLSALIEESAAKRRRVDEEIQQHQEAVRQQQEAVRQLEELRRAQEADFRRREDEANARAADESRRREEEARLRQEKEAHLLEEQQKLEALRAKAEQDQVELEQIREKLKQTEVDRETERQAAAQENAKLKQTAGQSELTEEFSEEFTCIICQELMLRATRIECGHTFCEKCIQRWLVKQGPKKSCPTCRKECKSTTSHVFQFDNMIEKIADKLPESEKQSYKKRLAAFKRNQKKIETLKKHVADAKANKKNFLLISSAWNERDFHNYEIGLKNYMYGDVRLAYLELIGLTPHWVETAHPTHLQIAANNLKINRGTTMNGSQVKEELIKYVNGPEEPMVEEVIDVEGGGAGAKNDDDVVEVAPPGGAAAAPRPIGAR